MYPSDAARCPPDWGHGSGKRDEGAEAGTTGQQARARPAGPLASRPVPSASGDGERVRCGITFLTARKLNEFELSL